MELNDQRHVWKIIAKSLRKWIGSCWPVICAWSGLPLDDNTVNLVVTRMEFVKAEFVWNDQENYETGTDADAKAKYVYQGIVSVPGEIPKRYKKVIFDHMTAKYTKAVPVIHYVDYQVFTAS